MTEERPETLEGITYQIPSPYGTVYVTLNENREGMPFEIFLNVAKTGSDLAADAEAIGRLCTLLLRLPSSVSDQQRIENMIRHLSGISAGKSVINGSRLIRSIPDAVAFALSLYLQRKAA